MAGSTIWRAALSVLLILYSLPGALAGQEVVLDIGITEATREELQESLSRFENAARSRAYSAELRARARGRADAVRSRLQEGDLRVGDVLLVAVEGEETLTDTFIVGAGRTLRLPLVGMISVSGVLRSELEGYLREELGRFINNPTVFASSLVRIAILGEVGRPGLYRLPPDTPILDALAAAGGPTAEADFTKLRIDRGAERFLLGTALQASIREGATLDEVGMRPGDAIFVPRRPALSARDFLGILAAVTTVVWTVDRVFGRRR